MLSTSTLILDIVYALHASKGDFMSCPVFLHKMVIFIASCVPIYLSLIRISKITFKASSKVQVMIKMERNQPQPLRKPSLFERRRQFILLRCVLRARKCHALWQFLGLETHRPRIFQKFPSESNSCKVMPCRHRYIVFHQILSANSIFTVTSCNSFLWENINWECVCWVQSHKGQLFWDRGSKF